MTRRRYNPHPLSDTCNLCDQPLSSRRGGVVTRGGRKYHRACWSEEKS